MRASRYVVATLSIPIVAKTASLSTHSLATNGGLTLVNPFWSIEATLKGPDSVPSAGIIASSNFPKLGTSPIVSSATSAQQAESVVSITLENSQAPTTLVASTGTVASTGSVASTGTVAPTGTAASTGTVASTGTIARVSSSSRTGSEPVQGTTPIASSTDIFADTSMTAITLGGTEGAVTYSRQTYSDLLSLSETTTITTSADYTDPAGGVIPTTFAVIVGPGGIHWTPTCGGILCPGGGPKIPTCFGILCPHIGGNSPGISGGGGSDSGESNDENSDDGESDNEDSEDENASKTQPDVKSTALKTTNELSSTATATTTKAVTTSSATSSTSACSLISLPPEEDPENGWIGSANNTSVESSTTASACRSISMPPEQDPENGWTGYVNSTEVAMTGTGTTAPATSSIRGSKSTLSEVSSPITSMPSLSSTTASVQLGSATQPLSSCLLATRTGTMPEFTGTQTFCMCANQVGASIGITTMSRVAYDYCLGEPFPLIAVISTVPPTTTSILPASTTTEAPPYATGKCKVHVRQGLRQKLGDPDVYLDIQVTDASGVQIESSQNSVDWATALEVVGPLPFPLEVTPLIEKAEKRNNVLKRVGGPISIGKPLHRNGPIQFDYGEQTWDTSSEQCSVGSWDNGGFDDLLAGLLDDYASMPNRQMDCTFDC